MITILIAEDEEILRVTLRNKLMVNWPEAKIIAEAENGTEALALIDELKPDVAFLDIKMGSLSGIDVIQAVTHQCHVIFVTAYDKYAIQAFEAGAVDYLLKPYTNQRMKNCIERVKSKFGSGPLELPKLLTNISGNQYIKKLKIEIGNKLWFIDIRDVIYFKASGRYITIVTKDRESLMKVPLKTIIKQLDPDTFRQIHRGTIINTDELDYIKNTEHEKIQAYMKGIQTPLNVSRNFSNQFK
ncbi:MAG: response regulator transcription factor [Colwellia sp.]|nr:response regulator transcription factor [Colwellia sp.]